jgi:hypothetical protein
MIASQRAFSASRASGPVRVSTVSVFARESRIGSKPIPLPKGVTIIIDGVSLKVKVDSRRPWGACGRFGPPRRGPPTRAPQLDDAGPQGRAVSHVRARGEAGEGAGRVWPGGHACAMRGRRRPRRAAPTRAARTPPPQEGEVLKVYKTEDTKLGMAQHGLTRWGTGRPGQRIAQPLAGPR